MLHYHLAPGLRFNDCFFTEPMRLTEWAAPGHGGILAVLARDSRWAPKPFQPLCFAEFGNGARHLPIPPGNNLYVAVLPMPFSTAAQRRAVRNELISSYNPVCQAASGASLEELSRRLDTLEARQEETHAQILGLLTQLLKLFEPLPVEPRRPIGFLAEPAY